MKKILNFISKYALAINIALFILSFALFFLPFIGVPKQFITLGHKSFYNILGIVKNGIEIHEYIIDRCVVYLLFFLILWIMQIANIILARKIPLLNVFSTIPFTGIFIYSMYIFADSTIQIPHIGFFVILLIFCFYLFETIVVITLRLPNCKPREHKPTDKERIAELERRITELEEKNIE